MNRQWDSSDAQVHAEWQLMPFEKVAAVPPKAKGISSEKFSHLIWAFHRSPCTNLTAAIRQPACIYTFPLYSRIHSFTASFPHPFSQRLLPACHRINTFLLHSVALITKNEFKDNASWLGGKIPSKKNSHFFLSIDYDVIGEILVCILLRNKSSEENKLLKYDHVSHTMAG